MIKKITYYLISFVFLTLLSGVLFSPKTLASSFQAGRIIDDSVFTNKNSMSVTDIQNFLSSKNSVCLRSFQTPSILGSNNYGSNVSAATAIKQASDLFNINPQVLLVTLQKEQGLITRTDCPEWRYRTAMGFGCPDGAPCDSQWFGLSRQLYQGARHFRGFYDQSPGWFVPFRPGNNFIQWSPNSACGGSNVNIQNRATASLYSYTPYQPNTAALNNINGLGDSCSAYGNRNFWRDFNNWFGSTISAPYQWEYAGQTGSTNVVAGQKATWTVYAKNTGTSTWSNSGSNPIMLGTTNPRDRSSAFCTNGWFGCNRPAKLNEANVTPGATGSFTFAVQAPASTGNYKEYFNLLSEGNTWFNDLGLYYDVNVTAANLSSTLVSSTFPATMSGNTASTAIYTIKNTGNVPWYKEGKYPVRLGTYSPADRSSLFYSNIWLSSNRPALMNEAVVLPNQNATFTFQVKSPLAGGSYTENYSLVAEGWRWFNQPISSVVTVSGSAQPTQENQFVEKINTGQTMASQAKLISKNGKYSLVMQSDGNLVLYSPNRPLWWTGTNVRSGVTFAIQADGNLVLYNPQGRPIWNTVTQGRGGSVLVMQDDGNLVLYNPQGRPIWNTQTNGRI